MQELIRQVSGDIKASLSKWSWIHCLLDAGLIFTTATIFGWLGQMPWTILLLLVVGIGMTATASVELLRRGTEEPRRLLSAKLRLKRMTADIPSNTPISKMVEESLGPSFGMLKEPSNWKAEAVASLRAMVRPEIVTEFQACLDDPHPHGAARKFLSTLEESITRADLRR